MSDFSIRVVSFAADHSQFHTMLPYFLAAWKRNAGLDSSRCRFTFITPAETNAACLDQFNMLANNADVEFLPATPSAMAAYRQFWPLSFCELDFIEDLVIYCPPQVLVAAPLADLIERALTDDCLIADQADEPAEDHAPVSAIRFLCLPRSVREKLKNRFPAALAQVTFPSGEALSHAYLMRLIRHVFASVTQEESIPLQFIDRQRLVGIEGRAFEAQSRMTPSDYDAVSLYVLADVPQAPPSWAQVFTGEKNLRRFLDDGEVSGALLFYQRTLRRLHAELTNHTGFPSSTMPDLFGRTRDPYYIFAPDFAPTSAGVRCLHYLCHALNELGEEAFLVGTTVTSPPLRTPCLDKATLVRHFTSGLTPIAVLPEVISGNPFQTPLVARWLLNRPGHLTGDNTVTRNEIIFAYDSWCLPSGVPEYYLSLPTVDTRVFNNTDNPDDDKRSGCCYYAHKSLAFGERIREEHTAFTSLCHDIPRSRSEIAGILRKSEALYCYEQSALIHEARSCGCPVLLVASNYWSIDATNPLLQEPGIGLAADPDGLALAKSNIRHYAALSRQWHALAWQHIRHFIEITQEGNRQLRAQDQPEEHQMMKAVERLWYTSPDKREKVLDAFLKESSIALPFVAEHARESGHDGALGKWLLDAIARFKATDSPPPRPTPPRIAATDAEKIPADEEAGLCLELQALLAAEKLPEAVALMEILAHRGSGRWQIYNDLGGHYAEQGRLPEAATWLEQGARLETESTHCLRKLTAVYAMQADFGRTLAASALILKKEPDDHEMQLFVRDVLLATSPRLDNIAWLDAGWPVLNTELEALRDRQQETLKLLDEIQAKAAALPGSAQSKQSPQEKQEATAEANADDAYNAWISRRALSEIDTRYFSEHVRTLWTAHPLFEFILVLQPGQEALLADTIDSLSQQFFDGWRLSIFAHVPSPDPEFENEKSNVRWIEAADDQRAAAINLKIKQSRATWLGFFECGTQFPQQTLLVCGDYMATHPGWRLIYSDDDVISRDGLRVTPQFKPDFNPDLLRATDYVGSFFVARDALLAAGGYAGRPGGERYDMLLRLYDACGAAGIGHIPDVLYHVPASVSQQASNAAATQSLQAHFARQRITAEIHPGGVAERTRRIIYRHATTPKVSIIIPSKNRLDLLGPCIESLLAKTRYADWEILIVDNGSDEPAVAAYYQALAEALKGRVRILSAPGEFNFSAINNLAAEQARGDYLLLLNNDTVILHDDWLETMMSHAQRPEIGIVGARLLSPGEMQVNDAGRILGMGGIAGPVFAGEQSADHPGYLCRALSEQNYSALSGACMLVRKALYQSVKGLDAEAFQLSNGDIDLCLKIQKLGYLILWTPFATLIHHGAATAQAESDETQQQRAPRLQHEAHQLARRWLPKLANDPAWNRNLSLSSPTPVTEGELVVPWNQDFRDRPRLLWMPLDSPGQAEYRTFGPLRLLHQRGLAQCAAVCQPKAGQPDRTPTPIELARLAPDTLIMHAPVDDVRCIGLLHYKEINNQLLRIYSLDDLITDIPLGSHVHKKLPSALITERLRLGLAASDRLIVSSEPLAEAYRGMIDDIRLLPNMLDGNVWNNLPTQRRRGAKLRVGWAGAQQHAADLQFMLEVVKATCQEVDWIFFGMMPTGAAPYVKEFHEFVHRFADYPAKLASLDLDLAVAPLEIHPFNEAKSNLRLLEYGILGWPVICTDIFPYRTDAPPVTRLPNVAKLWIAAIRQRIGEAEALAREGDALREWVSKRYLLENNLERWLNALTR
jgi:GT2 family glycosyltransferase